MSLRLLPALVLLAGMFLVVAPLHAADGLPQYVIDDIESAAERGRQDKSAYGNRLDERRRGNNRWLEAAVVSAIAENPRLVGPIVNAAMRAAPESGVYLVPTLKGRFPGFSRAIEAAAGGQVLSPTAPAPQTDASVGRAITGPGIPPPDQRPADWPILPEEGGADGYDDPIEGLNTVFFYVNGTLDFLIFEPLAKVYKYLMPEPLKKPVRRAFTNLSLPVVFANDLLQFEFEKAGTTAGRFLVNSTIGLAGLFDPAAEFGLAPHDADFGQTLHSYGVGDGFYLVLPFFGPTTVRDAIGFGVDSFLDPKRYLLGTIEQIGLALGEGVVRREQLIDPVDFLVEYADDPYTAVRAWTYQQRQRELTGGCTEPVVIVCPGF